MVVGAPEARGGWSGREPRVVVVARALAPWPLWLVLWEVLQGDPHGGSLFVFAGTAVVVGLMVRRASLGADRPVSSAAIVTAIALALGANTFFAMLVSSALPHGHPFEVGGAAVMMFGWLAGAGSYELARRCLAQPGLEPPRGVGTAIDVVAHQVLFVAPLVGLVDLGGDGLPLPLLVGPLVAVRVAGWHDARLPPPSSVRLPARTMLGLIAVTALLVAVVESAAGPVSGRSVAGLPMVLAGAASALLAAVALVVRAGQAGRALWGVVDEHRPDGLVLAVRGGPDRVHVLPRDPRPGGGLPRPDAPITLLDLEPVASPGAPYRGGPRVVRARLAWRGTADELASTLMARAWGWVAWSALSFAAAAFLLA